MRAVIFFVFILSALNLNSQNNSMCVPPTLSASSYEICSGQSVTLYASGGSYDGQPLTPCWFDCGSQVCSLGYGSSITLSPTMTTTYIANLSCSSFGWSACTSTITITVVSASTPNTPNAGLSSNSPNCPNVTISRAWEPPSDEIWYWQGFNANGTSTSLGSGTTYIATLSGTYYLRALNECGLWSNSSAQIAVNIEQPPSTPSALSSNSPGCNSVTITRNGNPSSGVTWYWQGTNPNGTSTSLGSGATYTATSTGTYYLRAKSVNGCWSNSSSSISVTVTGNPSVPLIPNSNSPQCNMVTITRSGNPPSGVNWYWQGTNPNGTSLANSSSEYNATSSGTYYIRSRNSIGCWSTNSTSVNVTVSGNPSNPLTPNSNSPQCSSVLISHTGSPPNGVNWYWQGTNPNGTSTANTNSSYSVNNSGTYYLRARNSIGCWSDNVGITVEVSGYPNSPANPISNSPNCEFVVLEWLGSPDSGDTWYWQGDNPNGTSTSLGSGSTYTVFSSGDYYIRAVNSTGCWSMNSGAASVVVDDPTNATVMQSACDSYTWIDGVTYTSSNNNATHILTNAAGCDSLVTLDLTIFNSNQVIDEQVACDSYTWLDGNTYTESTNTPFVLLLNQNGCDSTVLLELTINQPSESIDEQTACGQFTWIDGSTYTQNNNTASYTVQGGASNGCDSTITLNLNFVNEFNAIDEQIACESYTWIDGTTYYQSTNTQSVVLSSEYGCDSIITLHLELGYPEDTILYVSSFSEYYWNGITYTESGTYQQIIQNQFGCDSTITLNLNIDESNIGELSELGISVYPNPFWSEINVELKDCDRIIYISIIDVRGRIVMNKRTLSKENRFGMSSLHSGVYYLNVYEESRIIGRIKVIKC